MPLATEKPYQGDPQAGGGLKGSRFGGGQQQDGGQEPTPWNPSGYWPDPMDARFKKSFRPHEFIGALVNSQAGQEYGDVEGPTRALGVQGIRSGERRNIDKTKQEAASQGLGRGFATQAGSDIRQQGSLDVAEMTLGAHLEGRSRRFQLATVMAQSLLEANKARFSKYLQDRARESAEDASFLGGALGALGDIGGALIGAL